MPCRQREEQLIGGPEQLQIPMAVVKPRAGGVLSGCVATNEQPLEQHEGQKLSYTVEQHIKQQADRGVDPVHSLVPARVEHIHKVVRGNCGAS